MSDKQKVLDYIDAHQEELVQYLMELVRRPSVNPGDGKSGEESQVQGFVAESLRAEGFDEVRELAFDPEKRRPNVVGRRKGAGGGRSLIFNGHSDVVPVTFPERWIFPPFEPGRDGDRLYGRGTSDMKGGLAGAYFAIKALKDCQVRLKGDVILQAVAGEESQQADSIGTSKVVESGYRADFAICCEPSDTEVHIASSALIFLRLIVEGKGVHVSARNQMLFPQPAQIPSGNEVAVDAFRKSLPLVDYIHRLEVEWNHRYRDPIMGYGGKPFHDRQGVGVFTINPSAIHGGEYLGTIPSRMEYTYAIWYPDQLVSRDDLIAEVRRGVAAIASTDDWLREHPPVIEAPIIQDWPGFHVDENIEGVQVLCGAAASVLGREPVISGFKAVCDAYYLNKLGIPSVVLGPGSIFNSVHGDNEFILVSDLVKTTKVYAAFMMDWCGVAD